MKYRTEKDTMGDMRVPADRYWGAQTQRALEHFAIGMPTFAMPAGIIRALGVLKLCAARANAELGELAPDKAALIERAACEVRDGRLDDHFPLGVFQTGSGTQTNMNVNEVIANRANQLAGQALGSRTPIHPNDDVNRGQSSNDTFPTAMHMAVVDAAHTGLLPAVRQLRDTLAEKSRAYAQVVKTGRTHLMDAVPVTLGQEIGAWVAQLDDARQALATALEGVLHLAIGATAVGTGLNSHPRFGALCAQHIARECGHPYRQAGNLFAALAAHDALVNVSAALRTLAGVMMKIANDVRWLASGPRAGLGEIHIPDNEPGSSIMPGKVNPTQAEALTMVCVRVFGNDACVALAGSQGNFQLNVYKPVIAHGVLESIQLLGDAIRSFDTHCARGIAPNLPRLQSNLERNLMLVTALNRHIGYDKAAAIAHKAHAEDMTLKAAALELQYLTTDEFDRWVVPLDMTNSGANP
ncbi:MAG: class II fumarate hydratase [Rhodocyclales bacterium]|nr:class II fumarate hydratase [Rhodocyclales bacterium]